MYYNKKDDNMNTFISVSMNTHRNLTTSYGW